MERFKTPDNRKEVRFRLTPTGTRAFEGHGRFHERAEAQFVRGLCELSDQEAQAAGKLVGLLEERAAYIRALIGAGEGNDTQEQSR